VKRYLYLSDDLHITKEQNNIFVVVLVNEYEIISLNEIDCTDYLEVKNTTYGAM
jgi:hypothetical protein